ncbi:YceG family protein [Bacillus sp. ISL-40]|uniref:YceG family protein n=1 Tax=unclassified Bacillus (in: firmicutes) TaxID=185979 RepID=UPI001BE65FB0|nr:MULTISPECIES: YceG family protein [unclassified Bacillus (in: firmicutes)]MBT2699319.1 YceG family protein [Bacillus sp. ISL-40]MBT2739821.1 YceG family protein [Bacillus sp. ISL-77]
MHPSLNQLIAHPVSLSYENWHGLLKKQLPERPNYSLENGKINIGQVLGKFLGIPIDTDTYYNQLFDYVNNEEWRLHLLSEESLDKTINNTHFQSIQKVININREQKLSINRFTAFLDGEQLLLKSKVPVIHRKIREAMIATLELYAKLERDGLKNHELRRVLVDIVKWSINHLQPVLERADPQIEMPKFLWYGDFKKSHQYFLYYLSRLACDIVIFHPEGKDILEGMMEDPIFSHQFQNKLPAEPFPKEKRSRKATVAYRASKEIETILNQEGSGLYKPWQLRDYTPSSITLKTTYDELFILGKEMAMVRPDFEVGNGQVKIPSIFAKVQGVSKNRKEYWDRLQSLSELEHSLLIRRLPITMTSTSDFRFHYRNALDKDGLINPATMMQAHYWPYSFLSSGLQKGIANAVRRICEKPGLKPFPKESIEEVKMYLFTQALFMPKPIIQLIERFDYSQHIPKLIIFNNELAGILSRSDAALILLLNQFGIDIILYNPPGHNDIENFLDERLFDKHWLEDVVFDLEFKEPSIFKKGLFQGILKNLRGD